MKKIAITGFMSSILMATGAMAAPGDLSILTTKNYVDSGLRAVHSAAQSGISTNASAISTNASNISALQTTVGEHQSAINQHAGLIDGLSNVVSGNGETTFGLVGDVNDLKNAVNALNGEGTGSITSAIAAETQRATAAETANATAISDEVARATAAETANASAITAETQRATDVENGLNTRLTTAESDIDALEQRITNVQAGAVYTGTNGVVIDNNNNVGLNITPQDGSMYVYTSGGWTALPVEDTWDPSILE